MSISEDINQIMNKTAAPPNMPPNLREARDMLHIASITFLVMGAILGLLGIVDIVEGILWISYGGLFMIVYSVIYFILAFLGYYSALQVKKVVIPALDMGDVRRAKEESVKWLIIGIFILFIPFIFMLLAYLKLDESPQPQPQYQQYPNQQYQAPPPGYQQPPPGQPYQAPPQQYPQGQQDYSTPPPQYVPPQPVNSATQSGSEGISDASATIPPQPVSQPSEPAEVPAPSPVSEPPSEEYVPPQPQSLPVTETPSSIPSQLRRCPNCGAEVPEGAKFCPNCGQKI